MSKENFLVRFYRRLIEARWFYTFTASATATVVGISLTFGINSCRDSLRKKTEAEQSVVQAVDNLRDRAGQVRHWSAVVEAQNRIYQTADSLYLAGTEIPDSVCEEFFMRLPVIQVSLTDHEFEKIFRGSYQIWQVLDQDRLKNDLDGCFETLNCMEPMCEDLIDTMMEQIMECNQSTPLSLTDARRFTESMLARPQFRFYMRLRIGKSMILSSLMQTFDETFDEAESICRLLGYTTEPVAAGPPAGRAASE